MTSLRTRLVRIVAPFVALLLLQAFVAGMSLEILSAVRAYVSGEAVWSRAQKNAVYALDVYLHSGDGRFFAAYERAIAVPFGDRDARRALESSPPDLATATAGLLRGGNHPDDVPDMIWLFRKFNGIVYLRRAVQQWAAADPLLDEIDGFARTMKSEMEEGGAPSPARIDALSARLSAINAELTVKANAFSAVLGEGSRAIKTILTWANAATAALLGLLMIWITRGLLARQAEFESALIEKQTTLAWQATHDPLTGLANRREFEARLTEALTGFKEGGVPHVVVMIDLDRFKEVNDACGHEAGDALLLMVSAVLERSVRDGTDLVARLGGDEFALLLPACGEGRAAEIAERIRSEVEAVRFSRGGRTFTVTASVGTACIDRPGISIGQAVRQADVACYEAKKDRNRVRAYRAEDAARSAVKAA